MALGLLPALLPLLLLLLMLLMLAPVLVLCRRPFCSRASPICRSSG